MPAVPPHPRPPALRRAAGALLAALLVIASACGDDATGTDDGTTTTSPSAATEPGSPTETSPPTDGAAEQTEPELTQPTAYTDAAADAANELKAAWEAGDRERAAAIAPGDVVDALFAVPAGGFEVYGCDTGEFDTSTCNFRNRSTGAYLTVTMARHEAGWQVARLFVDGA